MMIEGGHDHKQHMCDTYWDQVLGVMDEEENGSDNDGVMLVRSEGKEKPALWDVGGEASYSMCRQ